MSKLKNPDPDQLILLRLKTGWDVYLYENMRWCFSEFDYYEKNVVSWSKKVASIFFGDVLDVGANNGYYSLLFAKFCSRVYAFEPTPDIYGILKKNLKRNRVKNVTPENLALSDIEGEVQMNTYSFSGNNSLANLDFSGNKEVVLRKKVSTKTTTIDSYAERKGVVPAIIKIDVEGWEMNVLKGGISTIDRYKPVIIIEYNQKTSSETGYNRIDIIRFLKARGYGKFVGLAGDVDPKLYIMNVKRDSQTNIKNVIALTNDQYDQLIQ